MISGQNGDIKLLISFQSDIENDRHDIIFFSNISTKPHTCGIELKLLGNNRGNVENHNGLKMSVCYLNLVISGQNGDIKLLISFQSDIENDRHDIIFFQTYLQNHIHVGLN